VNQEDVIIGLKNLLKSDIREMPHLLFAGPPGTGKTTTALALAREIYGDNWRDYVLELNASDERGINVIRERVKVFSQYFTPSETAPFKIVILDEADMMTSEAQTALRRIMELYARITRFILICNYITRIISPIQSRTAIFRFRRLPKEEAIGYLKRICESEGIKCDEAVLDKIIEVSIGDLRKAINLLQSVTTITGGKPTVHNVESLVGKATPESIVKLIDALRLGNFNDARSILYDFKSVSNLDGQEIIKLIFNELMMRNMLTPEVVETLAEYEYRIINSAYDEIQLTALIAKLSKLLSGKT
jgi:replication factor C small subunit